MNARHIGFLAISALLAACGSSKSSTTADTYSSCAVPAPSGSTTDLSYCVDLKDADPTSSQSSCTSKLAGTYAATSCTVSSGTKGCTYTNSNGVQVTQWFTGKGWTNDTNALSGEQTDCTQLSGTMTTK